MSSRPQPLLAKLNRTPKANVLSDEANYYWNSIVLELSEAQNNLDNPAATANMMGLQMPLFPGMAQLQRRWQLYAEPMSKLRMLMICRMTMPEEVLIIEDGNGNIVRETMKDNDVLVQYKVTNPSIVKISEIIVDKSMIAHRIVKALPIKRGLFLPHCIQIFVGI